MKKFLSIALCVSMIFASISSFAIKEVENKDMLLEDNFDSYTAGNAVTSIKGSNGTSASTTTYISAADDETKGMVAEVKKGAKLGAIFNDGASVSSGKLVLEFDGKLVAGNLWFSLLYSGGLGTRGKWFAGSDTSDLCTITANATVPGSTVNGYQKFTDVDGNNISYNHTGWSHYKFVVDIDNNSVTPYMDNKAGQTVTGYTYIQGKSIAGIGIYNATSASRYIDNLKIYVDGGYTTYYNEDDMEEYTVDEAIGGKYVNNGTFKAVRKGDALCKNATTDTVETQTPSDPQNIVAEIGNGTQVRYNLPYPESNEIICVSLDMLTGNGGFGIGIRQEGDSALNAKCPMWVHRNAVRTYFLKPGETSYSSSDSTRYYYSAMDMYEKYQWYNTKLYINAKTGDCWMDINGNVSEIKNLDYIGTNNTAAGTQNNPITAIVFYNTRNVTVNDQSSYIDNVSISVGSDGRSVSTTANGIRKIRLGFKDAIDAATLGTSKITVTKDSAPVAVTNAAIDSTNAKNVIVELDEALTVGSTYTVSVSNEIKYVDGNSVINGEYNVVITQPAFNTTIEIVDPSYTEGAEVSANYTINTTDLESKSVEFIIAAYKGDTMIHSQSQPVAISSDLYGTETFNLKLTLPSGADTIQAFAWSDEQTPFCDKARESIAE